MTTIECDIPKHRKLGRKARPFAIENNWGKNAIVPSLAGWRVWSRYETEKQREQAIKQLRKGWPWVEFRFAEAT